MLVELLSAKRILVGVTPKDKLALLSAIADAFAADDSALSPSTVLTVPSGATIAVVQAEGADVRWRDDGTAPTATVGMLLPAGAELRYTGALAALRLIQASAGATVNVSYYA